MSQLMPLLTDEQIAEDISNLQAIPAADKIVVQEDEEEAHKSSEQLKLAANHLRTVTIETKRSTTAGAFSLQEVDIIYT